MEKRVLTNLSEFTDWVEEVGDAFTDDEGFATPWFRGSGSSEFKLIPGIYRTDAGKEELSDDEVRFEFSRRALPLVADRAPRDDWEWYFLMQHYRAPTRLLDWTDSALVALYFALSAWSAKFEAPPAGAPSIQCYSTGTPVFTGRRRLRTLRGICRFHLAAINCHSTR